MHLVFLNQYFPPDEAPTGLMLEEVADQAVAMGHEVTVVCSRGGYAGTREEEVEKDYKVVRLRSSRFGRNSFVGKAADYFFFYVKLAFYLAFKVRSPDRIVALTTPPFLSVLARAVSRFRGGDYAHWVMDLYPDVMASHGMLRREGLIFRGLAGLAGWGFGGGRSAGVLSLGPDMEARISRYHEGRNGHVPLWATVCDGVGREEIREWREGQGWPEVEVVLMYSGNMGLGHRFGEFLKAAGERPQGVRFVFSGGGKRKREVEEFAEAHPGVALEVLEYVPRESLAVHLASADVHLVSMEPGWDGTMVPSKLQGIFAMGRPVIFVGSRASTIGQWIFESGGGWVVEPDDHEGMMAAIGEGGDVVKREEMGGCARRFAAERFDRQRNSRETAEFLTK
ncbi:MAG: glycosyltransferase family 4 protein [Verrucomicrobiaceae bacterium]